MQIIRGAVNEVTVTLTSNHTPTIYNITMTNANQEYSQALPANTKKFTVMMQENDTAFRIAYITGKVATPTAPYFACPAGACISEDFSQGKTSQTLYFACGTAGKTIQIIAWN